MEKHIEYMPDGTEKRIVNIFTQCGVYESGNLEQSNRDFYKRTVQELQSSGYESFDGAGPLYWAKAVSDTSLSAPVQLKFMFGAFAEAPAEHKTPIAEILQYVVRQVVTPARMQTQAGKTYLERILQSDPGSQVIKTPADHITEIYSRFAASGLLVLPGSPIAFYDEVVEKLGKIGYRGDDHAGFVRRTGAPALAQALFFAGAAGHTEGAAHNEILAHLEEILFADVIQDQENPRAEQDAVLAQIVDLVS